MEYEYNLLIAVTALHLTDMGKRGWRIIKVFEGMGFDTSGNGLITCLLEKAKP